MADLYNAVVSHSTLQMVIRNLRCAPLAELGPTTWQAASLIEELCTDLAKARQRISTLETLLANQSNTNTQQEQAQ